MKFIEELINWEYSHQRQLFILQWVSLYFTIWSKIVSSFDVCFFFKYSDKTQMQLQVLVGHYILYTNYLCYLRFFSFSAAIVSKYLAIPSQIKLWTQRRSLDVAGVASCPTLPFSTAHTWIQVELYEHAYVYLL